MMAWAGQTDCTNISTRKKKSWNDVSENFKKE